MVFFSVAEPSADAHAAAVVAELLKLRPTLRLVGIGGEAMAAAGCEILLKTTERSAMAVSAVREVGFFFRALRMVRGYLKRNRPAVVVPVDSPAFNFHVASAGRKLGLGVVYYIAPQLWAWAPWRIGKLRRSVDRLACILPFEEHYFNSRGVQARYVGHPLFDAPPEPSDPALQLRCVGPGPVVGLLPGSRQHELKKLLPAMRVISRCIRDELPTVRFIASAFDRSRFDMVRDGLDGEAQVFVGRVEAIGRAADLCIAASGTVTLQLARCLCPMLVVYHVGRLQWELVGRRLVRSRYVSLVNILAGEELVPEFVPLRSPAAVASAAVRLLREPAALQQMRSQLAEVTSQLCGGAARNTAEMVLELL